MDKRVTLTGANTVLFVFTALYLVFQVVLIIPSILYGEDFIKGKIYEILLINQYVIILLPVVVYTIIKRLNVREVFRLNKLDLLPGIIILLLAFPAQFAGNMFNSVTIYLLQLIGDIPNNPIPVPATPWELAVGILIIAVSPAICEELLHRGLMLKAYEARGSMKAVVFTAIFFGLFHFDLTNLLGATFLGLLIGYYVIRTNSIFAGMLAHFLNNAIYEMLHFFLDDGSSPEKFIRISSRELVESLLYGVAGLVAVGLLLMLFNKVTAGKYILKPSISRLKNDIVSIITHWPVIAILAFYVSIAGFFLLTIIVTRVSGL